MMADRINQCATVFLCAVYFYSKQKQTTTQRLRVGLPDSEARRKLQKQEEERLPRTHTPKSVCSTTTTKVTFAIKINDKCFNGKCRGALR